MKYYVKVTKQVAETIIKSGVPLTMTSDGNCLLYQSELNGVKGVNLNERAANVGGGGDTQDNDNISSGGSDNPSSENTGNENTDTKEESEVNNG